MSAKEEEVRLVAIPAAGVQLEGELAVPETPRGVVIFVHGSGSSRHSPRNQYVAKSLRARARVATLLFDLLTEAEEQEERLTARLRVDIARLAYRVEAATAWLGDEPPVGQAVGYFGSGTGTAAALMAAARRPHEIVAVVSRGGRPDLVGPDPLGRVRAPTLLIVGGKDPPVVTANRDAIGHLRVASQLEIVRNASHFFEEPGALEQVAQRAAAWFASHFVPRTIPLAEQR